MANDFEPQSKSVVDWLSERANRHNGRLTSLEIAQIAKVWIDPNICEAAYTFKNNYGQAGDPYELFQYRLFNKDTLQIQGTMSSGTNGAIGFTLLPPFWPRRSITILGNVEVTGSIQIATLQIDYTNGDVTVNY